MRKKIRILTAGIATVGASVLAIQYFAADTPIQGSRQGAPTSPAVAAEASANDELLNELGLAEEEIAALLSHPRVATYLQREGDKKALREYFSGSDTAPSDAEIWQLIESIESRGHILAYEALALKLAWLERNSATKAEFDQAAAALVETYRQKAERSAREYDPYEDVPGFAEYKAAEKRIVREVQEMSSFPDGMSRQEYLRKRLQEARQAAYGS
ncbi:hypothetical protein [Microbulbifer magnicolonia]|uniref:hypothetical protein n=1 Tax=Microbulbifer magnicolonia TaxID=3109744 RepID=UPI002B405A42|nr:hypothetical protein [Microbulbifer sp. GG15]